MEWTSSMKGHGGLELRCDMVQRALDAHRAAVVTRRVAIALVIALLILQLMASFWPPPWAAWVAEHRAMLALMSMLLTCFTAAHLWCARRRQEESEDALLAFVASRRA